MKTGRSLQDWAKEIERRANAKRDFMVDTRSMEMFNGEQGPQVSLELKDSRLQLGMTENAHRQIGTHLNIPAKYYELMRKENPELLVQNVNSWLEKNPTRRLVRALDGDMRAFLSDRYRCIDNLDIAECVLPIISKMPGATIESCEVTDDRMYIKVVNPRIQAEVVPGDIVQSGMLISNSEVGLGGVVVQPLVYRLVCTNGMVVNAAGEKRRHIGRIQNFSENRELFRDETLKADDRAFMMKLRDIVSATVDQTQFDKVLDIMRQAKQVPITGTDVPKVVELTGKHIGFGEKEGAGILSHLIAGGDLSLYGLSNAVTRFSQDVKSYDRATELEAAGYDVLTLSPAIWKSINGQAALTV